MSLFLFILGCVATDKPPITPLAPTDTAAQTDSTTTPAIPALARIQAKGILMVQVDTLRVDHLGAYDYERDTTPTLSTGDWLRMEGVSATSSWTPLSVSSLMTSLPPYQHNVRYYDQAQMGLNVILTAPRWSDALEAAGIHTFLSSGSSFFKKSTGIGGGFSAEIAFGKHFPANNMTELMEPVAAWLADLPLNEPFFIVLHVMNTHSPYFAPAESVSTWSDTNLPFQLGTDSLTQANQISTAFAIDPEGTRQDVMDVYDDQILGMDMALHNLEDMLSQQGRLDSTLLVFTADHGESFADHGNSYFGHGEGLPQEQVRIPLMLKHPQITPGILDCVASNMDTLPTLFRMVGWNIPLETQGQELQAGCRTIALSEFYDVDGILNTISAANKNVRLIRNCMTGEESAYDLALNIDGSSMIDPNTIPEIDSLRLSLDDYASKIYAANNNFLRDSNIKITKSIKNI